MNGSLSLEIHFYTQDEYAVQLGVVADNPQAQKYGEFLMFACYALRQMVNLGYGEVSDSLAELLSITRPAALHELGSPERIGGAKLVPYRGVPGNKNFRANLLFSGEDGSCVRFTLATHGFGMLARGMGYYAPTSVVALLRYLAKENQADLEFLNGLAVCAVLCAHTYLKHELTVHNQNKAAYVAAWSAWILPLARRLTDSHVGEGS